MGMKPVCWLSGLLLLGLALPGCESCNCWGNKSHTQTPSGYATATPPSSTGRQNWDNRGMMQPGGVAAGGQRQPGVTPNSVPAAPVVRTNGNSMAPELNALPQLPPSANRSVVEKPLNKSEIIERTTVPPTLEGPPAPEPPSPLPMQPEKGSPSPFEDRGGLNLTPPNAPLPPLPQLPERPPQP